MFAKGVLFLCQWQWRKGGFCNRKESGFGKRGVGGSIIYVGFRNSWGLNKILNCLQFNFYFHVQNLMSTCIIISLTVIWTLLFVFWKKTIEKFFMIKMILDAIACIKKMCKLHARLKRSCIFVDLHVNLCIALITCQFS